MLKLGMKVRTDFFIEEKDVVRTLVAFYPSKNSGSGYIARADGGRVCPSCGRVSTPTPPIDASWFTPVEVSK